MDKEIGMKHLAGHLLCVIDCETTGLIPGHHDIIQICVLPLNNKLKPRKDVMPFYMTMQPRRPENIDWKAMSINKLQLCDIMQRSMDAWKVADLFDEWFERLKLPMYRRIMVLGKNWPFDREFIKDWLGNESFFQFFDGRVRDLQSTTLFLNDRANFAAESSPFSEHKLSAVCTTLNVEYLDKHDALADCVATAEAYRKAIMLSL